MFPPSPRRITITIPYHVHESLVQRSDYEGRSISNLSAFLLEASLNNKTPEKVTSRRT